MRNPPAVREPKADPDYRVVRWVHELARLMSVGNQVDTRVFGSRIARVVNFERAFRDIREGAPRLLGITVTRELDDATQAWLLRFDASPEEVEARANDWIDRRFGLRRELTSPEQREENAEVGKFRRKLREMGLCRQCRKGPLYPGSSFCAEHREQENERHRQRRALALKTGVCAHCYDFPAEEGRVLCSLCGKASREHANRRFQSLRDSGLCQKCGEKNDREGVGSYCTSCLSELNDRRKRRPEGMCSRCIKRPARPGFKLCQGCVDRAREDNRKARSAVRELTDRLCECGEPLPFRKKKCKKCVSARKSELLKKAYADRIEKNLCVACGREPQAPSSIVGVQCAEKRAAQRRIRTRANGPTSPAVERSA